ncbi:hypothetical protein TIFTF001_031277 [Ficus carica]|uniref:Uncharacterized protein n=1 Tax=Ficus carica TaxID=3494 RepID=A0AA88J0R8_FICCA|nr:hypothetical protein TIFTF001_031277 [Ficus carica]
MRALARTHARPPARARLASMRPPSARQRPAPRSDLTRTGPENQVGPASKFCSLVFETDLTDPDQVLVLARAQRQCARPPNLNAPAQRPVRPDQDRSEKPGSNTPSAPPSASATDEDDEDGHDSRSWFGSNWIVIVPGFVGGLIFGVAIEQVLAVDRRGFWFIRAFN